MNTTGYVATVYNADGTETDVAGLTFDKALTESTIFNIGGTYTGQDEEGNEQKYGLVGGSQYKVGITPYCLIDANNNGEPDTIIYGEEVFTEVKTLPEMSTPTVTIEADQEKKEIFETSEKQAALFRTQNKVEVDSINLHAWLRRGELDFKALNLPDYNEKGLMSWIEAREWMKHIEEVDYFKSLPSVLSCFGVGLVFVPSLPKTVYGAIRWFDNKPLIQISDRGHDLVSCWFTLFHEFGHAMKHKNVEIYEGGINESKAQQNQIEKDANKFANKYLFNGDNLRKAVFDRKRAGKFMSAKELAEEFNVQPIFASYWLLKAQYAPAFQSRIQIDFTSQYQ